MVDFIVLPAYNEGIRIKEIISKVKNNDDLKIVVVDDGSVDNTVAQAKDMGVRVIEHKINLGKGSALRTGCDYALQAGARNIIVMDSDGQHNPKDIPRFIKALENSDIVYSYRQGKGRQPHILRFGNSFINGILGFLFKVNIIDSQCGFRAFTAEAYNQIKWEAIDYYMETEMIIRASKKRLKYTQIPIDLIYADKYKGTTVLDGLKIVIKMLGAKI
jgi:glycosyltransferase involved in cell wall biosynthesis